MNKGYLCIFLTHLLDPTASVDNLLVCCLTKGLLYCVCIPSVPSLPTNSFFCDQALVVNTANHLEQGQTKSVTPPLVQSYFVNVQRQASCCRQSYNHQLHMQSIDLKCLLSTASVTSQISSRTSSHPPVFVPRGSAVHSRHHAVDGVITINFMCSL